MNPYASFTHDIQQTVLTTNKVIIGSKKFTESHILATLSNIILNESDIPSEAKYNIGSNHGPRELLENGKIDLYWEYTGTAYKLYLQKNDVNKMSDPEALYQEVKRLDAANGIVWLNYASFNNTYVVMTSRQFADANNLHSISDLAQWTQLNPQLSIPFISLFAYYSRPDGLKRLMQVYPFQSTNIRTIHSYTASYRLVAAGRAYAAIGFNTNPQIKQFGLLVLQDDKSFFPVYNPAPTVRANALIRYPQMIALLNNLSEHLNHDTIVKLNYAVDIERKQLQSVCLSWLHSRGLIKNADTTANN